MKKSKRYIKKQNNKPLINKKVLAKVIRENSGSSAPWEINLVQRLCDWDIISPLRFTDEEWMQISSDGTCQNRRKGNVFKKPDGSIHYNGAFSKRATDRYSFDTKEWTKNKNPICWHGGLFEYKNNVLV